MPASTMNKNAANQSVDQARQEAGTAAEKAQEALGHVGSALTSTAAAVGQKADEAAGSVGHSMKSVANTVREQGPKDGMLGKATETVANAIDQSGKYLEDKQLSGIADDVAAVIKSHPIPAVLIGLGVGFLLGRALRE